MLTKGGDVVHVKNPRTLIKRGQSRGRHPRPALLKACLLRTGTREGGEQRDVVVARGRFRDPLQPRVPQHVGPCVMDEAHDEDLLPNNKACYH